MRVFTAASFAWIEKPWTCPKCQKNFARSGGKGSHLRWCKKREAHFWSRVDKNGPGGCWIYGGTTSFEGYGYVNVGAGVRRKQWQAHRFAWSLLRGPLPISTTICLLHTCDVRNCVNPDHLYLGDRAQNTRDKILRQRDTSGALTHEQVHEARAALQNYKRGMCTDLARKYGVTAGCISALKRGITYRHIPFAAFEQ